jgi:hypothetical protein
MSEEKVVGFIEVLERRFNVVRFLALCFTSQRLVIARTGHHNPLVWAFTLELGNTLMMARAIGRARAGAEELAKLPIGVILRADLHNHQILYTDIEKVEMTTTGSIVVHPLRHRTSEREYAYIILEPKKHLEAGQRLVSSVLAEKLVLDGNRVMMRPVTIWG